MGQLKMQAKEKAKKTGAEHLEVCLYRVLEFLTSPSARSFRLALASVCYPVAFCD